MIRGVLITAVAVLVFALVLVDGNAGDSDFAIELTPIPTPDPCDVTATSTLAELGFVPIATSTNDCLPVVATSTDDPLLEGEEEP